LMKVACALFAMLASCTFPGVTFDDGDSSMPLPDAGSDVDLTDASDDAIVNDAADAAPDPCDQDKDGYKSTACDGGDCNDNDPRVHPGADFRTDVPDAFPWGDWNCDGKPVGTPEFQYTTMTCNTLQCGAPEGFVSAEGCGITGPWEACTGLCTDTDAGTRTQGCR
jgi:hypothetical protein